MYGKWGGNSRTKEAPGPSGCYPQERKNVPTFIRKSSWGISFAPSVSFPLFCCFPDACHTRTRTLRAGLQSESMNATVDDTQATQSPPGTSSPSLNSSHVRQWDQIEAHKFRRRLDSTVWYVDRDKLFKISDFNSSNHQEQYAKVCEATGLLLASGLQTNQGFCNLLALLMLSLLINKYQDVDGSPTSILFLPHPNTRPPSSSARVWCCISWSKRSFGSSHARTKSPLCCCREIISGLFTANDYRTCTNTKRFLNGLSSSAQVGEVALQSLPRSSQAWGPDFNKLVRAELTRLLTIWPKGWLPGGAGPTLDPFAIEPGIQSTTSWLPVSTDVWGICQFQVVTTCMTIGEFAKGGSTHLRHFVTSLKFAKFCHFDEMF
ncbi:hypothetical protein K438DRAFT_1753618 [Mycena galopus ATCC 62051]|nr:hypothetical protein K438DRAFT_1753618 [Mycena galopus ATCC 62051]